MNEKNLKNNIDYSQNDIQRRLQQQELMSKISKNFISTEDIGVLVNNALKMTGEFMDAGRIIMAKHNKDRKSLDFLYEWVNTNQGITPIVTSSNPFYEGLPLYDDFYRDELSHVAWDDVLESDKYKYLFDVEVKAFLDVPIYIDEKFWGILGIDDCLSTRHWTESDIYLASLIANVISGAVKRSYTEEQLNMMSSIVDTTPEFVMYTEMDGTITYINNGALEISGYQEHELLNKNSAIIYGYDNYNGLAVGEEVFEILRKKGRYSFESAIIRKDGAQRYLSFSAFIADTNHDGIGVIATDITDRKQLEDDLLKAKADAEQSSKAKGDFLSRMSHEMRTPMNAIIGMTEIGLESESNESKNNSLKKIDEASKYLLNLINDVLDMSKIESGKFQVVYDEFSLKNLLDKVYQIFIYKIYEKKLDVNIDIDPSVPDNLISDEQKLSQIINNILSNAIKFTPEKGEIHISVQGEDITENDLQLIIKIKDTGIGISDDVKEKLFSPFEQADSSVSKKYGGTGLGLVISKNFTNALGGDINLSSSEGNGSEFTIKVKVRRSDKSQLNGQEVITKSNNQDFQKHHNILLAEDIDINREVIMTLLEKYNLSIEIAENGKQVVDLIKADRNKYDLILMDIHMPEMNGIEATQKIRSIESKDDNKIPIIAMTADVFKEDIEKFLQSGMDDHIGKPIDSGLLIEMLHKYLS